MPSSSPPPQVSPQIAAAETPIVDSHRETHRLEMRQARRAGGRWRNISRWLGLAFFVFGSALLIYVFLQALGGLARLAQPGALNAAFNKQAGNSTETASVVQAVIAVFGAEFLQVLYFLILGFIASAIAARGIQFFAASESVIDEAVVPED